MNTTAIMYEELFNKGAGEEGRGVVNKLSPSSGGDSTKKAPPPPPPPGDRLDETPGEMS